MDIHQISQPIDLDGEQHMIKELENRITNVRNIQISNKRVLLM